MLWLSSPIEVVFNWKTKRALTPFPLASSLDLHPEAVIDCLSGEAGVLEVRG
jgi:hypothetical protein